MKPAWFIPIVLAAILAWGAFHAYGAYTFNHNPWRIVMVLGCAVAFVAFWAAMLANRSARLRREQRTRGGSQT